MENLVFYCTKCLQNIEEEEEKCSNLYQKKRIGKTKGKRKYDQKRYGFLVRFAYVLFIVCEEITKLALSFLQRDMLPKCYIP